jgi:molybdenum cofactor guanylyltransferase
MGTLGVLVAGGAGMRLGLGVPKALVELGGRTLLERAIDVLGAASDDVVVCAPAAMSLPLPANVTRVDDPPEVAGPLGAMVAGLSAMPFDRAVVLGVDFPFLMAAMLRAIVARLDEATAAFESMACGSREIEAVIPAPGGIAQPLAAAYAPRARHVLAAKLAAGERAPSRAVSALVSLPIDDEGLSELPGGRDAFFNLNTPADLDEARRRMETGAARHAS